VVKRPPEEVQMTTAADAERPSRPRLSVTGPERDRSDDIDLGYRPLLAADVLVFRRGAEIVLHCGATRAGHVLNETAAAILSAADGSSTVAEIAEALCRRYDVDRETAIREVRAVIRAGCEHQLLGISF
jgi:Coenzyme PQQ synthesis protein D (PqqD)